MTLIMLFYYIITATIVGLLVWNFLREKKNMEDIVLYLLVLVPLVLRICRLK